MTRRKLFGLLSLAPVAVPLMALPDTREEEPPEVTDFMVETSWGTDGWFREKITTTMKWPDGRSETRIMVYDPNRRQVERWKK